ncbi:unnamed protein product [Strongylus vulgaris]|uniref:Glutathione peroxidase n=1 Tax=Strongylus vulgaris TaxID=40348 RepID=A0A3P7J280_STRVU|nr:unnamed protein product [Strongylus vulgaris]
MLSPILFCIIAASVVVAQPGMYHFTIGYYAASHLIHTFFRVLLFLLLHNCSTFLLNVSLSGPKMIDETTRWSQCKDVNQSIYDFQMETLQGQFTDLSQYRGQVLLIINVATFCAYTQQYTDFNPLIEKNANGGFTILAFPCNQFYLQEPAENHELMNGIMYVRPGNGVERYKPFSSEYLFQESCPQTVEKIGKTNELMYNPIRANDITWNFEKFLIDRQAPQQLSV